jgi:hypothetical protein
MTMQQALHIFVKDVRGLRYDLVVVLALTATFAWCEGHRIPFASDRVSQAAGLLKVLLPLAWWYLAAQVVFAEPLPGDCQFWVTRPYRWKSLLSAKLLFIAAFVNLPLLLSDCFIVALQGFHPFAHPAALAWRQVLFFAVLMLPMTVLACITVSIAQMALAVLAVITFLAVLSLWSFGPGALWYGSLDWVRDSLAVSAVFAAGLVVMVVQYRARRTMVSRIMSGVAIILVLVLMKYLPWKVAFGLQSRIIRSQIDASSVSARFEPGGAPPAATTPVPPGSVRVSLPIRFAGVPARTVANIDGMAAEFTMPDGKPSERLWLEGSETETPWHEMPVDRNLFERVKNAPLRLHVTILLTLFGNLQTERMPLASGLHRVPGVGLCRADLYEAQKTTLLDCLAPFRLPTRTVAQFDNGRPVEGWGSNSYSPYPAELGISPISASRWELPSQPAATAIVLTTMQPLAHVQRQLDIPGVRLADFAF